MNNLKKRIILLEDNTDLGYLLTEYLKMKNFEVSWFTDGKSALNKIGLTTFDLAILDVTMPDMDGFEIAEKIKDKYPDLPFLFLTARSLKVDVLKGFYLGAIDYLKKPIDEEELVIRIENILSRIKGDTETIGQNHQFSLGIYEFNSMNQELSCGNERVHLTTKENELLAYLVMHKDKLCSHKDILIKLWGRNDYFNKKSLNVFITRLRKYLEKDKNISINNIHGKGFIFRVNQ